MKFLKASFSDNKEMLKLTIIFMLGSAVFMNPAHVIWAFMFLFVMLSRLQEAKPDDIIELCKSTQ